MRWEEDLYTRFETKDADDPLEEDIADDEDAEDDELEDEDEDGPDEDELEEISTFEEEEVAE